MYVYVQLNHFAVHLKLTQHCKLTMLIVQSLSHVRLSFDPMDCSPPGFSVHQIYYTSIKKNSSRQINKFLSESPEFALTELEFPSH